jgi:hypothetical protein
MTAEDSPQPPVAVNCGRCSAQFLSRARHMMPVHCPRCGCSNRVKRWDAVPAPIARESEKTPVGGGGAETRSAFPDKGPAAELTACQLAPSQITASGIVDDDEDDEDDDDETYIYDELGRLVLAEWTVDGRLVPAAPARPRAPEVTWGDALAMLGWRLSRVIGGCQIVEAHQLCGMETTRRITDGWVCGPHYSALCSVISRRSA